MRISDWSSDVCSSDLDGAPRFQIADGVEDAAADLAIGRAGAIGAMLLKGADGQAEEARGFLCAQQARRQVRIRADGHGISLRFVRQAAVAATAGDRKSTRLNSSH